MRVLRLLVGAVEILWLACLLPILLENAWKQGGYSTPGAGSNPWVWFEAEQFAESNFPYASHATRGVYCPNCSGEEYVLFLPGRKGRPFDPPGHWYINWALRVPEPGDYRHVWIAYGPPEAAFSWTVDDHEPVAARIVQLGGSYRSERYEFRWIRIDPSSLDLRLDPMGNPHTLTLRRDDPQAATMWIDAILLTTDPNWVPQGIEKPPLARSYLNAFPDYVVYAKSYLKHVLPTTVPEEDEITEKLWTFATPGEYEPISFAIYARRNLEEVRVSVGDLLQGDHRIPASALDLRVVRVMERRRDSRASPDETEIVPEILDYYAPQEITAGTSKQYWLIIHVPQDAATGTYQGLITIAVANAPQRELELELEVLPFELGAPDRTHSIAYRPLEEFAGRKLPGDPFDYMSQNYQDMREHGLSSPSLYVPLEVDLDPDGKLVIDYGDFTRAMEMLVELGFSGPVHWRGISELYRDLKRLDLPKEELEAAYIEAVSTVVQMQQERSWPEVYFFPVDEPFGNPEKEAEFYYLAPLIKQVPGALVEVSLDGVEALPPQADPYVDIRFYSGWSADLHLPAHPFAQLAAQAQASGDRLGVYYNTRGLGGRPEFSRATSGFYLWNSPFEDFGVWVYQVFFEDPLNDLDGPAGDLAYAYPDPERNYAPTLPTLRWEGYREGVDDVRYLTTLERAIAAAQADPTKAEAVAQAQGLLEQLRSDLNRYGPEVRGIIAYFEPEDYQSWRLRIARAIIELRGD